MNLIRDVPLLKKAIEIAYTMTLIIILSAIVGLILPKKFMRFLSGL